MMALTTNTVAQGSKSKDMSLVEADNSLWIPALLGSSPVQLPEFPNYLRVKTDLF